MKKFKKILSVALTVIIFICNFGYSYNAVNKNKTVYLGGEAFGVKFHSNGVMVIKTEDFFDGTKYICPAKSGGLKVNDIITEANGYKIKANEDLQKITESCKGETLELKIIRNDKSCNIDIKPIKSNSGNYMLGAWIRDSCAGIGTVTYYDADNNYFAALGHGICDNDTSALLPLASGEVVYANINGVTKGVAGKAGSLNGYFSDEAIGSLTKNSDIGIYGSINNNVTINNKMLQIANIEEIKIGKAQLYTTITDNNIGCYSVEIRRICNKSSKSNENFVIRITDEELINKCGGIVQGMSGSPIVQNNKIIGAVTHVFVNDPTEGYGIFLQNMVDNYEY